MYKTKKISDCMELLYGKGLPKGKRVPGNFPVYGSNGIIDYHNAAYVEGPGIIVGRKGSVGEVSFSRCDFWPIDTTYYVKTKEDNDIVFWFYFLKTLRLNKRNSHSAVPGLNRNDVYAIEQDIPDYLEQKAIAKILSDLDSKIELNQQMNKTLEDIGRALFKRWFIDFEFPNENGKPYKSSGGEMVDSELGKMPKRWRVGAVTDITEILSGFAFKSSDFTERGKYRLVTIKNVQDGCFGENTKDGLEKIPEKMPEYCKLKIGDILLSLTGNVGRICHVIGKNYLLNQRVAKLQPLKNQDYVFVYLFFRQRSILNLLENISSGTAQQNLSPIQTGNIKIVISGRETLDNFGNTTSFFFNKILKNNIQIQALTTIRDLLLPRLMSGRIRVEVGS